MIKRYATAACMVLLGMITTSDALAQAYRKGSLLVSVSEGATYSRYTTTNTNGGSDVLHNEPVNGDRDPLTVEYGLSKHWGIGLNTGTDIFKVSSSKFYGFETSKGYVKALMTEFTVDGHYHFFVTKKWDLSASVGLSSVSFRGNDGDRSYRYDAGGLIGRMGVRARYYFFRRFGVMGMYSVFANNCSTKDITTNTVGQGYSSSIRGAALEFGLCYRILR